MDREERDRLIEQMRETIQRAEATYQHNEAIIRERLAELDRPFERRLQNKPDDQQARDGVEQQHDQAEGDGEAKLPAQSGAPPLHDGADLVGDRGVGEAFPNDWRRGRIGRHGGRRILRHGRSCS